MLANPRRAAKTRGETGRDKLDAPAADLRERPAPLSREPAPIYSDYLHERIETMPRAELEQHQEAQLKAMLAHAYERSGLVRQVWDAAGVTPKDIRSLDDFRAKAPFISKDAVRDFRDANNDPCGGLNCAGPGELKGVGSTSGTTGDPTPVPQGVRQPPSIGYARDLWHIGARPGDYVSNIMFTFRGGHRGRVMQEVGFTPILFTLSPLEMPRLCEASKRFRPTALTLMANPLLIALEQLFEKTGEDPTDVFKSYKGAIFGGEPLGARLKGLAKSWGLEIFETTSLGDIAGATECRVHDGHHAWEDIALVECLHPVTEEPVADGEIGEMVVTALTDRFMPLIRYKTDDLITADRSPCACGRTHMRFKPVGRKGDQIIIDGLSIMPRDVLEVVENHTETRAGLFQVIRPSREMDELRVRIGFDATRLEGAQEALASRLVEHLQAKIGVTVVVELTLNEELLKLGPPHKIPRVTKQ
ncbi:MAG: phenylacetate--CoA ligase family protein [Caulobacter sp.]|nr:phenylacetate--CoA ligase family protein [Caulobacter sp.]